MTPSFQRLSFLLIFVFALTAAAGAPSRGGETGGASPGRDEEISRAIREARDELEKIRVRVGELGRTLEATAEAVGIGPEPIPINTAGVEELQRIEDVGPGLARRIMEGRPYSGVSDLMRVEGMGEVRLGSILGRVVFDMPERSKARDASGDSGAGGGRTIYVSSTGGSDGNRGLSEGEAVRTLERGVSLLVDGTGGRLLLQRGDTWTDQTFGHFEKSGASADEPMVIGAYGDPADPRPVIEIGGRVGMELWGRGDEPPPSHLVIRDLYFYAHTRDPADPRFNPEHAGEDIEAIRCRSFGEDITIEDCRFDFACVTVQSSKGMDDPLEDFVFRGNVVYGSYTAGGGHAQGMYVSKADGCLIENNLFDHNGWNERVEGAERTLFNHNLYFSKNNRDITVRGNVFARGSFYGVKGESGGVIEGNVFFGSQVHLSYLPRYDGEHRVSGNWFLDAVQWRGSATRGMVVSDNHGHPAAIEGNLFAGAISHGIDISDQVGPVSAVSVVGNRFDVGWRPVALYGASIEAVTLADNAYAGDDFAYFGRDVPAAGYVMAGNESVPGVAGVPAALPEGWLEEARERWGEEGYSAGGMLEGVRRVR